MSFKQPGAFAFAKVDVFGYTFQCDRMNRVAIMLFYIGKDLPDPFIFQIIFSRSLRFIRNMLQKQTPHYLEMDGNIQFIKLWFLFIQGNNGKEMFPVFSVPWLALVNTHCREHGILDDWFHVFAINSALKKTVN